MTANAVAADPTSPAVYTVRVTHHWSGRLEYEFRDVGDSPEDRASIAHALREVARHLEDGSTPSNVVSLSSRMPMPSNGEPNSALVKLLADAFAMARDGKLQSLVGTGFTSEGLRMTLFAAGREVDVYAMCGAIDWLKREYQDRVLDEVEKR